MDRWELTEAVTTIARKCNSKTWWTGAMSWGRSLLGFCSGQRWNWGYRERIKMRGRSGGTVAMEVGRGADVKRVAVSGRRIVIKEWNSGENGFVGKLLLAPGVGHH